MRARLTLYVPDCIANFPVAFDADYIALDMPESSPALGTSMTSPLLADTADLDGWMAVRVFLQSMRSRIRELADMFETGLMRVDFGQAGSYDVVTERNRLPYTTKAASDPIAETRSCSEGKRNIAQSAILRQTNFERRNAVLHHATSE